VAGGCSLVVEWSSGLVHRGEVTVPIGFVGRRREGLSGAAAGTVSRCFAHVRVDFSTCDLSLRTLGVFFIRLFGLGLGLGLV